MDRLLETLQTKREEVKEEAFTASSEGRTKRARECAFILEGLDFAIFATRFRISEEDRYPSHGPVTTRLSFLEQEVKRLSIAAGETIPKD